MGTGGLALALVIGPTVLAKAPVALMQGKNAQEPVGEAAAGRQEEWTTVWSGVYSESQAIRGEEAFSRNCGRCHGRQLEGSDDPNTPPLSGRFFMRGWRTATLADLFITASEWMPQDIPGSLSPEMYADILSFILKANGMPAGDTDLPPTPETLQKILITEEPPDA